MIEKKFAVVTKTSVSNSLHNNYEYYSLLLNFSTTGCGRLQEPTKFFIDLWSIRCIQPHANCKNIHIGVYPYTVFISWCKSV